jgi:carbon storage regulator
MLVLTRKTQQQIQIGPHITITILEIKGHSVRVGIEAPRDVNVFRTELALRIAQERASSTGAPAVKSGAPQAAVGSTATGGGASEDPSVRCRAPRVALAPRKKHPQRTGPASLGSRYPAPLQSRLSGLFAR